MNNDNENIIEAVNIDTAYEDVANAIIKQAAHDYRLALVRDDRTKIESIERFFKSERYTVLTTISGEFIMNRIKKELKLV